jgi:hypothetical protein
MSLLKIDEFMININFFVYEWVSNNICSSLSSSFLSYLVHQKKIDEVTFIVHSDKMISTLKIEGNFIIVSLLSLRKELTKKDLSDKIFTNYYRCSNCKNDFGETVVNGNFYFVVCSNSDRVFVRCEKFRVMEKEDEDLSTLEYKTIVYQMIENYLKIVQWKRSTFAKQLERLIVRVRPIVDFLSLVYSGSNSRFIRPVSLTEIDNSYSVLCRVHYRRSVDILDDGLVAGYVNVSSFEAEEDEDKIGSERGKTQVDQTHFLIKDVIPDGYCSVFKVSQMKEDSIGLLLTEYLAFNQK